jgi:hypothetical protein
MMQWLEILTGPVGSASLGQAVFLVSNRAQEAQQVTNRQTLPTSVATLVVATILLGACQPTVRVEPPQEPITINLNIKLDADVRVRLEEQAEEDIEANPDIF